MLSFTLDKAFVDGYRQRPVRFGWNGLGEMVFYRTYSRDDNPNAPGGRESWTDVCERVINYMYSLQKTWCLANGVNWNEDKAIRSALEAFDLMFNMKWSPPGRGLWMAGTPFVVDRQVPEALQNCAFVSTNDIAVERGGIFAWLMEMSMLGVGVGFDTRGAGKLRLVKPSDPPIRFTVTDTREGWAKSVAMLINSYCDGGPEVQFDYSLIRPKGAPIRGFGGVASGPDPLIRLHQQLRVILDNASGNNITSRTIVDIANLVGLCVVSGNVRRSAEIAYGEPNDWEFVNLKNYELNPERQDFGWVSNNSVFAHVGMHYGDLAERTYSNGEPGYFWLDNARQYGRMNGLIDRRDEDALGTNPCVEQILHHKEMCTLVEIYLPHCKNKQEFERAIKYAYLYGKSITLASDMIGDPVSREVMQRNRRIGLSLTGVTQFLGQHGAETLRDWMGHGYYISGYFDRLYSQWLGVNRSIRRTSIKPSGTVSLVAGVTPGIHFNVAGRYHIRRMILADNSSLVDSLRRSGYEIEPSVYTPDSVVVNFPVDSGPGVRSESEVDMYEQLNLIAMAQRHWADNAVSATVKFDRNKVSPRGIEQALMMYETRLKGISFLPLSDHGYEQAPYESITEERYREMMAKIEAAKMDRIGDSDRMMDLFCDGEACSIQR